MVVRREPNEALETDAVHDRVRRLLASSEQRYTAGRRRLVELLVAAGRPVTLPELRVMDPSIPQSSTYRNLDVLERTGLVQRVTVGAEHARYELSEPLLGHHHHLICVSCGRVEDITLADSVEELVEQALEATADDHGFTPQHHRLDLHGSCATCDSSST